jgi:hypothetical protein
MSSPFLEAVRADLRLRGYSIKTEHSYLDWIRRYIRFTTMQHPGNVSPSEITGFLTHLAVNRQVSVNTSRRKKCIASSSNCQAGTAWSDSDTETDKPSETSRTRMTAAHPAERPRSDPAHGCRDSAPSRPLVAEAALHGTFSAEHLE